MSGIPPLGGATGSYATFHASVRQRSMPATLQTMPVNKGRACQDGDQRPNRTVLGGNIKRNTARFSAIVAHLRRTLRFGSPTQGDSKLFKQLQRSA